MKIAGQTVYVVLLTITMVMRSAGNHRVSVTIGDSSVLTCPFKENITLLTWKISPKVGGPCTLSYRADTNMTHNNCSNNINWKFRPGLAAALEIQQVRIAQEGNYICEMVTTDGNFHTTYHLTVLAPPRLSLYCDKDRSPVCEAAVGKPPAQVSWVPESNSTAEEKWHHNGTVTVLSRFTARSTRVTNMITCMVSHPAGNWSQSIVCEKISLYDIIRHISYIIPCLLIITFTAVIYYFKLHGNRPCHKTKPPEIAPTHSQQAKISGVEAEKKEDDMMEVEPYTTYVQKENAIYNSVFDLTAGQNLPQDLWPET